MKKVLAVLVFVMAATMSFAQVKLGHTNVQEILMLLPERATAEKDIQDLAKKLETRLETMSGEYDRKVNEFKANRATMTETIQESSIGEIQDLERRIQEFQQTAQMEIQNKQDQLLQPMITKINTAIDEVGKAQGFTYIFDSSTGAILFEGGEDVTSLVRAQLGL